MALLPTSNEIAYSISRLKPRMKFSHKGCIGLQRETTTTSACEVSCSWRNGRESVTSGGEGERFEVRKPINTLELLSKKNESVERGNNQKL